jgi:hypothetical protein
MKYPNQTEVTVSVVRMEQTGLDPSLDQCSEFEAETD